MKLIYISRIVVHLLGGYSSEEYNLQLASRLHDLKQYSKMSVKYNNDLLRILENLK